LSGYLRLVTESLARTQGDPFAADPFFERKEKRVHSKGIRRRRRRRKSLKNDASI
jgi:hypothetical protein